MIAKIVQGRGFRGVVNYVLDKDNAQLLYAEGVRTKDKDSIIQSFVTQSKMNPKIARPIAHISLDFSAQDKAKLTDEFMVGIAQEYLKKMGYENTQYIIARHHDTDHPHIHMVINRFDKNGYGFNGSKIDRSCSYSKISFQLQQNDRQEQTEIHQQPQAIRQENSSGLSSIVESGISSLGGLFDIQPSSGYDENEVEAKKQEAKKKKKKRGRRI